MLGLGAGFTISVSCLYRQIVGDMEDDAKRQHDRNLRKISIRALKINGTNSLLQKIVVEYKEV